MSSPTSSRRWARRLVAPFVLGMLLTVIPIPQVSFVDTSVVQRLGLPVLEQAGAASRSELSAALDDTDESAPIDVAVPVTEPAPAPSTEAAPPAEPAAEVQAEPGHDDHAHDGDDALPLTDDRIQGAAADVAEFTAIGLLFDEAPTEPVLVRIQGDDGTWGDWRELEIEADEGPDVRPGGTVEGNGAPAYGTAPLWVGSGTGYELNLATADAPTAEVALVRDEQRRAVADSTPAADASVAPPLGIRTRAEWGARPTSTSNASSVRLAVVHHSASGNSYSPAEVPGILRSIQAFHMDGRGWSDIAYNFVVDKYGGAWEGRAGGVDKAVIGAHAQGFNTGSVGVMVIGDYLTASVNANIIESVSRIIGWKLALHGVDPTGRVDFTSGGSGKYPAGQVVNLPRVVGHQDVGQTSCPGSIQGSLGAIRNRSQEWTTVIRTQMGPQGSFGGVVPGADGTLTAIGWVVDLDVTGPTTIELYSGGRKTVAVANVARDDIPQQFPGRTPNHGFWVQLTGFSPGWHEVCIMAINQGNGTDTDLGCQSAAVPYPSGRAPSADISVSSGVVGAVDVAGWARNEAGAPAVAQLTVSDEWRRTTPASGFSERLLGIREGAHRVCAMVDGFRADCSWVWVRGAAPIGGLDGISAGNRSITASGWAYDPETLDPIPVAMIINGRWYSTWADGRRPDWMSRYPGYGDAHGFRIGTEIGPGTHWTCVAAINTGGGADTMLGCQNVVIK